MTSRRALTLAAALLCILPAACTRPAPVSPAEAVCGALAPALPTWSRADSERSKTEGARFMDVWEAVCGR